MGLENLQINGGNNSYTFQFNDLINILYLSPKANLGLIDDGFKKIFLNENSDKIDSINFNFVNNKGLDEYVYQNKINLKYIPRNITTDLLEDEIEYFIMDFLDRNNENIILKQDILRLKGHMEEIKSFTKYRNANFNDYKAGVNNISSIKFSKKNIAELEDSSDKLELQLDGMERIELNKEDKDRMDEIKSDHKVYENLEREKNLILLNLDPQVDLEPLKQEFAELRKSKLLRERISYILIVVGLILAYFDRYLFGIPLVIGGLALFLSKRKIDQKVKRLGHTLYRNNKKEKNVETLLGDIKKEQDRILNKYTLDSRLDFKKFVDKIDIRLDSINNKNACYDKIFNEKEENLSRIDREKKAIKQNEENLKEILSRNRVKDLSELALNIDYRNKRDQLKEKYKEEKKYFLEKLEKSDLDSFLGKFEKNVINKMIKNSSKNCYNKIKLNSKLNMVFVDGSENEYLKVDIKSVEDIYSMFRFDILNDSEENTLPIIFNNCFTYFKEREKENVFNHIKRIGHKRQVIFITYNKEDLGIFEAMKVEMNLLKV